MHCGLEKARGPSAAAREGERGTKMKGGGGGPEIFTGKIPTPTLFYQIMPIHSKKYLPSLSADQLVRVRCLPIDDLIMISNLKFRKILSRLKEDMITRRDISL